MKLLRTIVPLHETSSEKRARYMAAAHDDMETSHYVAHDANSRRNPSAGKAYNDRQSGIANKFLKKADKRERGLALAHKQQRKGTK